MRLCNERMGLRLAEGCSGLCGCGCGWRVWLFLSACEVFLALDVHPGRWRLVLVGLVHTSGGGVWRVGLKACNQARSDLLCFLH